MLKNRLFLTFTALALGVSLVGVANAGTINSAMNSEKQQPAQYQTDMTEHKVNAMNKAMELEITKNNEQAIENDISTQDKQVTDTKANAFVMGPQNMTSKDSINQMHHMHDHMNEIHQSIPHQQIMGKSHVKTMHHGSGMMGR